MKKKQPSRFITIVLPIILVVLLAATVVAVLLTGNRKKQSGEKPAEPGTEAESQTAAEPVTAPVPETLHFVDAHDNWYDVEVDPGVEKHSYNMDAFSNDGTVCTYQDGRFTSRRGIDVSSHQGDIDWYAVADAGIEFVFIRIGFRGYGEEGTLVADERFPDYVAGAREAGLDVGCYFFSQAVNEAEAVEEAEFCLNLLAPYELQLPVVFDSENILDDDARTDDVSGEQFTDNAIAFCERILQDGRFSTAIYSNMKWEAFTYDLKRLAAYPLWYADYEPLPQTPYHFVWWQYSETGSVNGISVPVDLDIQIMPK